MVQDEKGGTTMIGKAKNCELRCTKAKEVPEAGEGNKLKAEHSVGRHQREVRHITVRRARNSGAEGVIV